MYNKYDIVTTFVEFNKSFGKGKTRPVMITGKQGPYYIAVEITKHAPRNNYPKEFEIKDWKQAGLKVPSTIRFIKCGIFHERTIDKYVGRLSNDDIKRANQIGESIDDISDRELFEWLSSL